MSQPLPQSSAGPPAGRRLPRGRRALLEKHRWLTFLLPLVIFLAVTSLEPTPNAPGGKMLGLAIPYAHYPWVYTAKVVLTVAAMLFVLPGYREFPLRFSLLGALVGAVGIVVWVGLCRLRLETKLLAPLGQLLRPIGLDWLADAGTRSAFDPLAHFQGHPGWAWGFLAVRFFGLVVVVAAIEEFFVRGFLMRLFVDADWWEVPIGKVNAAAVVAGTAVPMLMHPQEFLAAAAWFSMVTWLMIKTRNLWDCVLAHAVTNLLLGVYVVFSGDWHLM